MVDDFRLFLSTITGVLLRPGPSCSSCSQAGFSSPIINAFKSHCLLSVPFMASNSQAFLSFLKEPSSPCFCTAIAMVSDDIPIFESTVQTFKANHACRNSQVASQTSESLTTLQYSEHEGTAHHSFLRRFVFLCFPKTSNRVTLE
jgi:hypothetical protein